MGILDCDDAAVCCLFSFDEIGRDAALIGMMHCCRLLVVVVVVVVGKFWTGIFCFPQMKALITASCQVQDGT